jgi:hypothetical protein
MKKMLIAVALSAALLAACSGAAEPESAPPEAAESANSEQLRAWASDVCQSADDLAATVTGVSDGLDVDLSQGLDQLPAIQEQVTANLDEVDARIEAVEDALSAVPDGSASATAFAAEMEALVDSARTSGQEAIDLLAEAGAAMDLLNAGLAAAMRSRPPNPRRRMPTQRCNCSIAPEPRRVAKSGRRSPQRRGVDEHRGSHCAAGG